MSAGLGDRLADLADDAPRTLPADGLWQRGRRRQRVRQAAATAAGVLATAGGLFAVQVLPGEHTATPILSDVRGHLPDQVYPPSEWSTPAEEPFGPLAVLDGAMTAGENGGFRLFGISASDGRSAFLDLPSVGPIMPGVSAALSPDGRKVAFVRHAGQEPGSAGDGYADGRVAGWTVYDTVTGELTELSDPMSPVIEDGDFLELGFSGDSRYLLTNYSRTQPATSESDELVAWDVETGERLLMEGPGHYLLPNLGSAPRGVVWARDHTVLRIIPGGPVRDQRSVRLPLEVVDASWGPDDRAFAYVGDRVEYPEDHEPENPPPAQPWELYVGPTASDLRRVTLPADPGGVLGWRDDHHVVVSHGHQDYAVVDVRTGATESGSVRGVNLFQVELAGDLWDQPLVDGVKPPEVGEPGRWRPWIIVGLFGSLVGGWVWIRRRRG